jgi:hypothetical protein
MVKVKLITDKVWDSDTDGWVYKATGNLVGKEYEAFEIKRGMDGVEDLFYTLNMGDGIYHADAEQVEVIEEPSFIVPPEPTPEELDKILKGIKSQGVVQVPKLTTKILLCEDGSVIEEDIKELGIPYIIYRKGANLPFILEI